jgi:hypothetical protein
MSELDRALKMPRDTAEQSLARSFAIRQAKADEMRGFAAWLDKKEEAERQRRADAEIGWIAAGAILFVALLCIAAALA